MLLYTAGYAHWTVPALAAELTRLRAVCVDVRMYPVSQRPAWGGADLQAALEASGVSYVHLPALGNPNAGTGGPLALAHPERGIPWLLQCLKRQPVVVLCQCPDWRSCHRSLIVAAVCKLQPSSRHFSSFKTDIGFGQERGGASGGSPARRDDSASKSAAMASKRACVTVAEPPR